ncbi:hypothetical protein Tco_1014926 [Tanacetum coccineum]
MAEPNDYITATRKNFVSNDNEGRIVEKCIVEIQETFLVKIRDYAFNGNIRENVSKHIDKFLEVVRPIKINGLTQNRFRLSVFPVSLAGAASEWFIKEFIGSITTWDNMVEKWYDELADGKLKDETLAFKAKIEGSCTGKTARMLVEDECSRDRPIYSNYEASNDGDTQENQGHEEHKGNPNPEQSNCKIRRFEMMKYSFNDDEECITIKDSEHLNHSKDSLDAYRELLRLIDEGWVVTTPDE